MNNPTVIIDGKVQRLFKFQEDVAQKIVSSLNKGYGASINLKTGCGRQVILQRVVDLLSNRNRYQARSAQSILEQQIGNKVNEKLQCLGRIVRAKDSWSDTIMFPFKSGGIGKSIQQQILDTYPTSYNLTTPATPFTMKTKPLTKLQKIKQKAYQEGVESQAATVEHYRKCLTEEKENNQSLRNQIERLEQRISSFRDTMQAINTISQGTSRL